MYYTFDSAWETFLRVAPKFADSHYYDIMSYSCGFISFLIVLLLRNRVKRYNAKWVMKNYYYDVHCRENGPLKPLMIYRIRNLFIPLVAYLLGVYGFYLVAANSDRIKILTYWLPVAGLVPIAIYTVYEFLESGILGWIFTIIVIVSISIMNYRYCLTNENHHKACFAVRLIIVFFGIVGGLKQFLPPFNTLMALLKSKTKQSKGQE